MHQVQRRQARRRQRSHQIHRRAGIGVGAHQPGRIVLACCGVRGEAVDHVAAVGPQAQGIEVGRAGLGVLAGDAGHLDHRQAGAVGQHHRHLQEGADIASDVGFGVVGERLGAVTALQQEGLTLGNLR